MRWTIRQICENIAKEIPTVTEKELLEQRKNMVLNMSMWDMHIRAQNEPIINKPKV